MHLSETFAPTNRNEFALFFFTHYDPTDVTRYFCKASKRRFDPPQQCQGDGKGEESAFKGLTFGW